MMLIYFIVFLGYCSIFFPEIICFFFLVNLKRMMVYFIVFFDYFFYFIFPEKIKD